MRLSSFPERTENDACCMLGGEGMKRGGGGDKSQDVYLSLYCINLFLILV